MSNSPDGTPISGHPAIAEQLAGLELRRVERCAAARKISKKQKI